MRVVSGRSDGKTVVLDEEIPVNGTVEVKVTFPDPGEGDSVPDTRRFWNNARAIYLSYCGSASDELLRQRGRFDVTPSGLPVHMPSDEEWQQRGAEISRLLRQWQSEAPSDDLATIEEIRAGLAANPVRFREVKLDE